MKAIIIYNLAKMPNDCWQCEFGTTDWDCVRCSVAEDERGFERESKATDVRPSWCPLKEMPKKRGKMFLTERSQEDTDLMVKSAFANCYTDGWNACLEEIEK